jgi:hypothetical protein
MFNIRQITTVVLLGVSATSALASEVYIQQAGSTTTINITQTGTTNIVSGDLNTTNPAIVSGDGIALDLTQTGDYNEAAVKLDTATSANVDYTAIGSNNILDVYIDGGSSNVVDSTVTGDGNRVSICGSNDGTTSAIVAGVSTTGPACSTGISANDVTNTVNITGDTNIVNVQTASLAGTTNTVNVGANIGSNNNLVNIEQTNTDVNLVEVSVDGNTNVVNIIQN